MIGSRPTKYPSFPNRESPIFLHSIDGSQFTTWKPGDFRRPQRIVALAIDALKFPATDIFAEQEFHRLVAL